MSVSKFNKIQCGNIFAESSSVTIDSDVKLLSDITFNSVPLEGHVLTFLNGRWQAVAPGGSSFEGDVEIADTLNVGKIRGIGISPELNVCESDIIRVDSIQFSGGIMMGNINTTIASGSNSIALGIGGDALALNSIAIGTNTTSSANNSIALGYNITAGQSGGFFVRHRGPGVYTTNGAGFISGTNELVELTSSIRFKENIRDLEEVSSVFDLFRPVRYQAKPGHGDDREHIGLIAEEVEALFPEFVIYDNQSGAITGLMFDKIIAVTIKEIKAMRAEESEQEALITMLEQSAPP